MSARALAIQDMEQLLVTNLWRGVARSDSFGVVPRQGGDGCVARLSTSRERSQMDQQDLVPRRSRSKSLGILLTVNTIVFADITLWR